jgi:hypothetical protein
MISYSSSISDRTDGDPLRILVVGPRIDPALLLPHHVEIADDDSASALDRVQPDLLVLDARSATETIVAALEHPRHRGLPILLLAGPEDADLAGTMMALRITAFLPPHPDAPALAAAIAAAISTGGQVADTGTRYDPLSRIEELQRDAERMAAAIAELAARRDGSAPPTRPVDAARIRAHIRARRLRNRFFPDDLFADPAWDMLLDLSAARLEGRKVSVSSLCIAADVPTTTGLRWIKTLVDRGLFERHSDPSDARRAFIALSPPTAETMTACLEACFNLPGL